MKIFSPLLLTVLSFIHSFGQLTITPNDFLEQLKLGAPVPDKLLSERSVVFYPANMTDKELNQIQESFQNTGIDAIAYFEFDLITAGYDAVNVLSSYFNRREVGNLVFLKKVGGQYEMLITKYNKKMSFVEKDQPTWNLQDASLSALLKNVFRTVASALTNENLLIMDFPEKELAINPIAGRRSEFFAIDMKVDKTAIPKTGNEEIDKELESIFEIYPLKHEFSSAGKSEKDMRGEGNMYVLRFVYAPAHITRNLLGYEVSKTESAYVSVTYPNGQPQLKSIPSGTPVYKFYFKHIPSGNVFLGTKWDADTSWQQALKNHIMAFKAELNLN